MRPTALVWFEGTLAEGYSYPALDLGSPVPGMKDAMAKLSATHTIIIASVFARTIPGRKRVHSWLMANGFSFAGLHDGPGLPPHDVRYDNAALLLE